ncbi:hypothetical protein LOF17_06670, partial [Sinorhizobium meliloti]|uniref:hypothetical protein n=1 Tax=Rhizobium meliloti TaxID=382 RepID=UPI002380CFDC
MPTQLSIVRRLTDAVRPFLLEPQMDKWLRERRALQRDLQAAISQQQLSIVYQPQADIGGDCHWLRSTAAVEPSDPW